MNGRGLAASAVLVTVLAPPPAARYRASQLGCAAYAEAVQTAVQQQSGTATVGDKLNETDQSMKVTVSKVEILDPKDDSVIKTIE